MPTYEYVCTECDRLFELFQPITDKPRRWIACECEQCHNKAPVRRCIGTGGGVIFKGSGFYTTDYRSESYKQAAKAESGASDGKSKAGDKAAAPQPKNATSKNSTPASGGEGSSTSRRKKKDNA